MGKKDRLFKYLILIYLCFFFSQEAKAEMKEQTPTGTLIVTYCTGPKAERLDRIRFWLKSDSRETEMYPKGQNFVYDEESVARTIVIEGLALGNYTLHFLIPNKDGFFKQVSPREITIKSADSFKIDQKIKIKK